MKKNDLYNFQKYANLDALMTAPEYNERRDVLLKMVKVFKRNNVQWALTSSANLFFRGIVDNFSDFDMLFSMDDIEKAEAALEEIGATLIMEDTQKHGYFASGHYREGFVGSVHLDIIGDMTLTTFGTQYKYVLKEEHITYNWDLAVGVPLSPMEADILFYGMMEGWQPKRRLKRRLCYEYIKNSGVIHQEIFEEASKQNLPDFLNVVMNELEI